MTRDQASGVATALAVLAALVFGVACVNEIAYVVAHSHSYGPAKVIAWMAGAGSLLAVAVGVLAVRS